MKTTQTTNEFNDTNNESLLLVTTGLGAAAVGATLEVFSSAPPEIYESPYAMAAILALGALGKQIHDRLT